MSNWPVKEETGKKVIKEIMDEKGSEMIIEMLNHSLTCEICGPKFFLLKQI